MKKIVLLTSVLLLASFLSAGVNEPNYDVSGAIEPTFKTATSVTVTSSTIVAAGTGQKNCLTEWELMSTTLSDMKILDGTLTSGTTLWALMQVPASTRIFSDGVTQSALCGSANTQMVVSVSSGTVSINYRGYTRRAP